MARVYGVVTAYDGALADVGRIVADSTWHHYFNVNLKGFAPNSAEQNEIADFYVNLAVWLAPPAQRDAMRCWFWCWLATKPTIRMLIGNSISLLGRTALDVLGRRASQCVISELLWPFPLLEVERVRLPWPPEELVIGGILEQHLATLDAAATGGENLPDRAEIVRRGITRALEEHVGELRRAAEAAEQLEAVIAEKLETSSRPRR
jgi:hypothetical protein